jgi:uncharacterized protein YprB with RNaseH-like and TPR domain
MSPSLGDRLRGIVNVHPQPAVPCSGRSLDRPITQTADVLGGRVQERAEGAVVVVDRHYAIDRSHGRMRVGDIVERLQRGSEALRVLRRAWPQRSLDGRNADLPPSHKASADRHSLGDGGQVHEDTRLLFLDIETTGLAGGAGTQAFLIGCAVIEEDELLVRQFLLPGFEHERALLAELRDWAAPHDTLITFNGRTFDAPLIETRYLFHRLEFPLADAPHIDMLHASRRLWKERPAIAGPPLDEDSCKLSVLERHLAGVHRVGDVPGFEIPSRFFRFIRSGDAFPLEAVLEHNRIDLLSLALVTAHAVRLIEEGPAATRSPSESLGLGRLYERAAMRDHAESCYMHAATFAARVGREPEVRAEALRRLALGRRRAGRAAEAALAWSELVALPSCPSALRREAREALAIHHEHRSRDLQSARMFVLDALAENPASRWREQAQYRLKRIEKKLTGQGALLG